MVFWQDDWYGGSTAKSLGWIIKGVWKSASISLNHIMVRVWGSLPFLYNRWHWMCIKSTLASRCLAGFGLCLITKTQAAVSIASAHPQSGSRPTRCGALSPFRPRSPGCYGLRFKKRKFLLSCKKNIRLDLLVLEWNRCRLWYTLHPVHCHSYQIWK